MSVENAIDACQSRIRFFIYFMKKIPFIHIALPKVEEFTAIIGKFH
jgi:hypothetical protein